MQFLKANFALPWVHNVYEEGWYRDRHAFERDIVARYPKAVGIHIWV